MEQATARPPATTQTEFLAPCQRDSFAQTLTYPDVPRSTPGTRVERSGAIANRGMRLAVIQGFLNLNLLAECTLSAPGKVSLTTCASSFMKSRGRKILMTSRESLVPFVKPFVRLAREEV